MKPTANSSNDSSMRQAAFCEPRFKRLNYFSGQFLSPDDFTAEQESHIGKQRLHNLHCHGFGVLHGLKVATTREKAGWTVVIKPGVAIDPKGNEIQLCTSIEFQLSESQTAIQVGVRFAERLCDPVPVTSPNALMPTFQPSRVEEGVEVRLTPVRRAARANARKRVIPQDVLPLARLVRNKRAWQVDRKFKVPRAH